MPCPFFVPQHILCDDSLFTARQPLGQAFDGRCLAEAPAPLPLKVCNHGYARGRCDRFPASHAVDANRFAKTSTGEIVWIEEADCAPLRFAPASAIAPEHHAAAAQLRAFQQSDSEGKIR